MRSQAREGFGKEWGRWGGEKRRKKGRAKSAQIIAMSSSYITRMFVSIQDHFTIKTAVPTEIIITRRLPPELGGNFGPERTHFVPPLSLQTSSRRLCPRPASLNTQSPSIFKKPTPHQPPAQTPPPFPPSPQQKEMKNIRNVHQEKDCLCLRSSPDFLAGHFHRRLGN